jgi:hypothetical protein
VTRKPLGSSSYVLSSLHAAHTYAESPALNKDHVVNDIDSPLAVPDAEYLTQTSMYRLGSRREIQSPWLPYSYQIHMRCMSNPRFRCWLCYVSRTRSLAVSRVMYIVESGYEVVMQHATKYRGDA